MKLHEFYIVHFKLKELSSRQLHHGSMNTFQKGLQIFCRFLRTRKNKPCRVFLVANYNDFSHSKNQVIVDIPRFLDHFNKKITVDIHLKLSLEVIQSAGLKFQLLFFDDQIACFGIVEPTAHNARQKCPFFFRINFIVKFFEFFLRNNHWT